jgi:hypothetical protein
MGVGPRAVRRKKYGACAELEPEWGVAADAVQSVLRKFGNLVDGVGAHIGKLGGFQAAHTCSVGLRSGA